MKVYTCPENVQVPELEDAMNDEGRYDMKKDDANNQQFFAALKAELQAMGYTGPLTGEVIRLAQGDGSAIYMVADAPRKTCLIHCPLGDAWTLPEWQTNGLTKKVVKEMIAADRRLAALFGRKKDAVP